MDTFRSMNDLVAHAQDLLITIGDAQDPEVRLLKKTVEASPDEVRQQARRHIKGGASTHAQGGLIRRG